eukprot:Rhum_TRINITY_DN7593_c0_g1::Rhum_TRINITY_DN7593_c0_g1_i1::g.23599::m.23599
MKAVASHASRQTTRRQVRTAYFTPPVSPWRVNSVDTQAATQKLYQKQLHSSNEWEEIGTPHNYMRFLSPGEPGHQLKAGAQFSGQWQPQYQLETLRQSGVSPQYREYAPASPFDRDIYNEWLNRNQLDNYAGPSENFIHQQHNVIATKERANEMSEGMQDSMGVVQNWDHRRIAKDELRNEKFEDYMRKRAQRNRMLGIDKYGVWNKKTIAYLKKIGDY